MNYELLIVVPGLVNEAAAELSLESLAALSPAPSRITVVDWSHDIHGALLDSTRTNRHGLAGRSSACLDELFDLADEVWSENLIPYKRKDPVGPPMWCCQCKAKAWGIGEAVKRGVPRLLYMQFGDRISPSAPEALMAALEADAQASFAFLQVYRCRWDGSFSEPSQFVHQAQFLRNIADKHRFMPGSMFAADRLHDTRILDDRQDWPAQSDDLLTRQLLLANGHGVGVPRSASEHVFYYHVDPNPLGDVIRGQYVRATKANDPHAGQAGRPLLDGAIKESAAAHAKLLAKRGAKDRAELRQRRQALQKARV